MDNANSPEYLEKIKIQVIENLKKTTFAPSVQMQDVPRDSLMGDLDEQEDVLDDADEDDNPDVRNTERRRDLRIARDDELDESEDEEGNKANGVHSNGAPRRRNIMDYQNPLAVDDMDVDSGAPTPDQKAEVPDAAMDEATTAEVNAEVNAEVMEDKLAVSASRVDQIEPGASNAASRADSPAPAPEAEDVEMAEAEDVAVPDAVTEAQAAAAAHVATPPESPVPAAEVHADTVAPVPTEQPTAETAEKEAGEAERVGEDVTAEASTEIAEASEK